MTNAEKLYIKFSDMDRGDYAETLENDLETINILVNFYGPEKAREKLEAYQNDGGDIFADVRKALYKKMSSQLEVLAEHNDSTAELWQEINTAPADILAAYIELYL